MQASILTIFSLLISIISYSQNNHSELTIDLTDQLVPYGGTPTTNKKFIQQYADNIGTILIDGYLHGKLRGYKFRHSSVEEKWGPPRLRPADWERFKEYHAGEEVFFNDKAYRANSMSPDENLTPENNFYEWDHFRLRDPIGWKYFIPSLEDTLTKPDFLRNMIEVPAMQLNRWDSKWNYFVGELVWHNGRHYEAWQDNTGQEPGNNDFWEETYQGYIQFARTRDLNQFTFLQNYVVVNSDTIHHPQIVTLNRFDNRAWMPIPVVHFYFDEFINYLNSLNLPAIYKSEAGYIGKGAFVLDDLNRFQLLLWLKDQIKTGKPKIKKGIIQPELYKRWLADTITTYNGDWDIFQTLKSNNLILSQRIDEDGFKPDSYKPFLKIPVDNFVKQLTTQTPPIYTYSQAIQEGIFKGQLVDLGSDSIPVKTLVPINKAKSITRYSLSQEYKVNYDALPVLVKSTIPEVWSIIRDAKNNQSIKEKSPTNSYFPAKFNWSLIGDWDGYHFDQNFTIGSRSDYWYPNDTLKTMGSVTAVSIVVKKRFDLLRGFLEKYEIENIAFYVANCGERCKDYGGEFRFSWPEVKNLLLSKSVTQYNSFIKSLENDELDFHQNWLIYGLMEEN